MSSRSFSCFSFGLTNVKSDGCQSGCCPFFSRLFCLSFGLASATSDSGFFLLFSLFRLSFGLASATSDSGFCLLFSLFLFSFGTLLGSFEVVMMPFDFVADLEIGSVSYSGSDGDEDNLVEHRLVLFLLEIIITPFLDSEVFNYPPIKLFKIDALF